MNQVFSYDIRKIVNKNLDWKNGNNKRAAGEVLMHNMRVATIMVPVMMSGMGDIFFHKLKLWNSFN